MLMKTEAPKLEWHNIDVDTLGTSAKAQFSHYLALDKQAKEAKAVFEQGVRDQFKAPAGKKLVFGYKWGKLSIALTEDTGYSPKAPPKQSLAEFLASQASAGRRV